MRLRLVIAALLLLTAACARGTPAGRPRSLVLIVIDTLRADHLGSYGYAAAHTPHLDALAARGARFTDAMTPVPVTLPAVASLLTGRLPFHTGVRDNESYVLPPNESSLAERFRSAGFRTGAVLASAILSADRGLDRGFETYDDSFEGPYPVYDPALAIFTDELTRTRRRADAVTDRAAALADRFGDEPFFLLVHYFDPHSYYDPPPEWGARHPGRPYDGEISFVDAEVGRLLERVAARNDVAVVVVSDHGESLGEHGEPQHGFLLYQSTLHVPILAAGPGIPPGTVRDDPVSLVDLEPTIAAWFGLPASADGARDGRALVWDRPEPPGRVLYAETMRTLVSYGWSEARAVRKDSRKLIAWPSLELFDLAADPRELHPLADPGEAAALSGEIARVTGGETRARVLATLGADIDPARKELLESLGYLGTSGVADADTTALPDARAAIGPWLVRQHQKARYREGVALLQEKRTREGLAILDSVLTRDPGSAEVWTYRAFGRRDLGDEAGYRSDLAEALRLDPDFVLALSALAYEAEAAGRGEEARARWLRIVELDPVNTEALNALARESALAGRMEEALPWLRRLVNARPDDADARCILGLTALRAGRAEEARLNLEAFLRMAPDDPRAAEARDALAGLEKR